MKSLLLSLLLLTGCTTVVPVTQKWPAPPGLQATQGCADLKKLETDPKLSQVARTVSDNYTEYWICATKLDAWIEWYNTQRKIFEGVK